MLTKASLLIINLCTQTWQKQYQPKIIPLKMINQYDPKCLWAEPRATYLLIGPSYKETNKIEKKT